MIDEGSEGEPRKVRVSASQLDSFDKCSLKWKFQYIDKLESERTLPQIKGSFVHAVLEDLFELPPVERTPDNAKTIARVRWDEMVETDEYKEYDFSEAEALQFRQEAWLLILAEWQVENPESVDVKSIEIKIEYDLDDESSFIGYADRLDNLKDGIAVVDYKSGRRPANRFSGDKKRQIRLYALGVKKMLGERVTRGKLLFLGGDHPGIISEKITESILEETEEDLMFDTRKIVEARRSKGELHIKAGTSPLCGWCEFVGLCSEGESYLRGRIANGDWKRYDAPAIQTLDIER